MSNLARIKNLSTWLPEFFLNRAVWMFGLEIDSFSRFTTVSLHFGPLELRFYLPGDAGESDLEVGLKEAIRKAKLDQLVGGGDDQ